ncbi:hypothetical protein B0T19DRAFT_103152 [Cercophora scortea]|uniref:C2H2-type domain-containing protein n=1 Tax=Cercophora scortea TaxID=314031 RepID=A0AAE0MH52_9PEZI|nr:hypothetical protein B0T19DRAFT_103152 [Cercophora scortea]
MSSYWYSNEYSSADLGDQAHLDGEVYGSSSMARSYTATSSNSTGSSYSNPILSPTISHYSKPSEPDLSVYGSSSMVRSYTATSSDSAGSSYSNAILSPAVSQYPEHLDTDFSTYGKSEDQGYFASIGAQHSGFEYEQPEYQRLESQQDEKSALLFSPVLEAYQPAPGPVQPLFDGAQPPSPSTPTEEWIRKMECIARELVSDASIQILGNHKRPSLRLITNKAVEDAKRQIRKRTPNAPTREAIQEVLYRTLYCTFTDPEKAYTDTSMALYEAAYQLQLRVEGPEASDISYYAIMAVLDQLRKQLQQESAELTAWQQLQQKLPESIASPREKEKSVVCLVPDCRQKPFSRQADLDRHYKQVHLEEDKKIKFKCDYRKCNRHEAPFYRQDHFRDHLREYHKEDILRRGKSEDVKWWQDRQYALEQDWWRCNGNGCFNRVQIAVSGFECSCGSQCEAERQKRRLPYLQR